MSEWLTHPWVVAGSGAIRFGIGVTARVPAARWDEWRRLVQTVEALGFDSFWVPDHPGVITDCWTILAALASATTLIRLGPLVDCIYFRTPLILARRS